MSEQNNNDDKYILMQTETIKSNDINKYKTNIYERINSNKTKFYDG